MKILTLRLIVFLLFSSTASFSQTSQLTVYKSHFDSSLKTWRQSFKNFQLKQFKLTDTIKFENIPFADAEDLKEFYSIYKPALSFSGDKSKFIDIYSYWLNLEKKGNKLVDNPEVDQAISLCNLKTKKWTRIFFCGYSTRVEEVLWLTDTKFILTGSYLGDSDLSHPKIFIGDIPKQQFLVYDNNLSIATKAGYVSPKLKALNIQNEK